MMFLSHGTQDLYPDFLGSVHKLAPAMQSYMAILYNIGAIVGAIVFGQFSDKLGRRVTMISALSLALLVIPLWAFGTSLAVLAVGSFLMQAGVQGAWGVIPVHLSELSADETRGLVPGLAYQLGILIAAPTNTVEFMLREHVGYQWALAGFEIVTIAVLIVTIALGKERKGRSFIGPLRFLRLKSCAAKFPFQMEEIPRIRHYSNHGKWRVEKEFRRPTCFDAGKSARAGNGEADRDLRRRAHGCAIDARNSAGNQYRSVDVRA